MQDEPVNQALLLRSLQRALVGAVPASLRAVTCDWTDTTFLLRFIFDGPIDPDNYEDMQVVGTEVIADFPPEVAFDEQIIRVDYPASLAAHFLRAWAYMRNEGPTDPPHEPPADLVARARSS